jgi:hypothetical protein
MIPHGEIAISPRLSLQGSLQNRVTASLASSLSKAEKLGG